MNMRHINPRLAVAVLAAVFAVVLAAPAQADPPRDTLQSGSEPLDFGPSADVANDPVRPDDRAERSTAPVAEQPAVRPDDRADRTTAPSGETWAVRPDYRAFRGPQGVPVVVVLRPDDRADRRLPNTGVVAGATSADPFDWIDAGIGAGAAFGLALLVAGASAIGLRHRRAAALS